MFYIYYSIPKYPQRTPKPSIKNYQNLGVREVKLLMFTRRYKIPDFKKLKLNETVRGQATGNMPGHKIAETRKLLRPKTRPGSS